MEQRSLSNDCPSDDHSSIGPYDERPTLAPQEGPLLEDDDSAAVATAAPPRHSLHLPDVFLPPPGTRSPPPAIVPSRPAPAISPQLMTPPSLDIPRALQPGQPFAGIAPFIPPPAWAALAPNDTLARKQAECGGWDGAPPGGVSDHSAPTLPPSPAQWGRSA